jgi:membrane protease YdiL (CAAX protease family)
VSALHALLALQTAVMAALVFLDARGLLPDRRPQRWLLATLLTAGLAAAVYLLVRPSRRSFWGLPEVMGLPVFFVLAALPLSWLLASSTLHLQLLSSLAFIVGLTVLQNAAFAAAALYVALIKYHLPAASLGLGPGAWGKRVVAAAFASGAALGGNLVGRQLTIVAAGLVIGQQRASSLVTEQEVRTPVFRLLREFRTPSDIVALAVLVAVIVPIGEEIFFRGLTYGALRHRLGRHAAVAASAAFFALAHLQLVEFLPIFILGAILAYLYEYTGSLVPGMIAHAVNNLAALALFYANPMPSP